MNGYNFTERVRKILAMAREEAARLQHRFVGTEHMLLGLVREGEGVGAAVLRNLHTDLGALAEAVEVFVAAPRAPEQTDGPDLPYTGRAKKVLELSMAEARELNHQYVGSEHLLLGLLREEVGIAARALNASGVTLQAARTETLRLLGYIPERGLPDRSQNEAGGTVQLGIRRAVQPRGVDEIREHAAWTRLTRAIEISHHLGMSPSLTLEPDGSLTVPLGPDLVVSVEFPPGVRLRRRGDGAVSGGPTPSAQEPA